MAMGLLYIPVLFLKDLQLLDSTQKRICDLANIIMFDKFPLLALKKVVVDMKLNPVKISHKYERGHEDMKDCVSCRRNSFQICYFCDQCSACCWFNLEKKITIEEISKLILTQEKN